MTNQKKFECVLGYHTYDIRLVGVLPQSVYKKRYIGYYIIQHCPLCNTIGRISPAYIWLLSARGALTKIKKFSKTNMNEVNERLRFKVTKNKLPFNWDILPNGFKGGCVIK